ncbi:MAG: hypothetical protein PHG15_00720 [Acinetobacter sp.]|uniref:hypothetical protein n=1 Tax=Acinetobacter sp. TaxID=472 RepID=UPI00260226F9|nr:hypothetical protein [Acinetobacter sp.]MDD2944341.1 hypothetical protein [Acinetobacter sp.]
MCKLKFGTTINFAKIFNSSFERSFVLDDQTKQILAKPDLPELVRKGILATFKENELLTGLDALYASLGRFDLLEQSMPSEFKPVNVRYECDPRMYGAMIRDFNRFNIDSTNFLMSYIQWRTGEAITDCDWNVTKVWDGLLNLHKTYDYLKVITD